MEICDSNLKEFKNSKTEYGILTKFGVDGRK